MNNYPPGFTQGQHDRIFADALNQNPNREECFLCRRMIQQDPDTGWWFVEDESGWIPTHKSDFTNAYQTQEGWICSTVCYDDHTVEPGYDEPQLLLIQGGRA